VAYNQVQRNCHVDRTNLGYLGLANILVKVSSNYEDAICNIMEHVKFHETLIPSL